MKKLFLLPLLFAFEGIHAQVGTITPALAGTFVSGVSPVLNSFSLDTSSTSPPAGTTTVWFKLLNGSGTSVIDSIQGTQITNGWNGDIDMGKADSASAVYAAYYDGSGIYLDSTQHYLLSIVPKPQWMIGGGYVTNVISTSNPITMTGHLPIFNAPSNSMPSDVPGLDGRPYDLGAVDLTTDITYDYTNPSATTLGNHNLSYNLNVFNQTTIPINYALPATTGITLDNNFNLAFIDSATSTILSTKVTFPLAKIPTLPVPYIKVDGGFGVTGDLSGKLVYGKDVASGNYGFIGNGNDTTRITAKITLEAFLRVTADALVASVSGTLKAIGSIGGGFTYDSFRSTPFHPLFGLDLQIAGDIDYKLGLGWLSTEGHFHKDFYGNTVGDQLARNNSNKSIYDHVDAMGNYTHLLQSNPNFVVPDFYAQPNMSANDSLLYVVWLDYVGNDTKILFSKFDYQTQIFSAADTVRTAEAISNPKVAILPSGDALISWTENRYNSITQPFDTSKTMVDLFKAQDILVTLYDKTSGGFAPAVHLSDNNSTPESGRAEGNANIIMSKGQYGSYGLITWVVNNDTTFNNADVWFCPLAEVGGNNVVLGSPQPLINLTGTNRSINIAYYDSTHAIASWIFDPDGLDSTLNNKIVYMEWTQTADTIGTWSPVDTLITNNGFTNFDDVSADFNGIYGAIAWTSTEYSSNGDFTKKITADAWNGLGWATASTASDTNYYFAQPKVTVNKNGVASLT
ncbi:MAG: hypothetical protein ACXVDW_08430, partial [Bacteroidia bacterium]